MRKVFLGLALFALTFYCHAQSPEIEQLRKQIEEHTQQDTARVNLLIKISYSTPTIPIEEIEKNAAEALTLSRNLKYAEGEGFALALESRLNLINRNIETAFTQLNQADSIAKKTKNLLLQYSVNFHFISYYNTINDYRQALSYALQAEEVALKLGNLERVETSQRQIANLYRILGDYAQALDYSIKSLKNAEELNSQARLYNAWYALATTYTLIGDYEKSNDYLQKLTDLHKQLEYGNSELRSLYITIMTARAMRSFGNMQNDINKKLVQEKIDVNEANKQRARAREIFDKELEELERIKERGFKSLPF